MELIASAKFVAVKGTVPWCCLSGSNTPGACQIAVPSLKACVGNEVGDDGAVTGRGNDGPNRDSFRLAPESKSPGETNEDASPLTPWFV